MHNLLCLKPFKLITLSDTSWKYAASLLISTLSRSNTSVTSARSTSRTSRFATTDAQSRTLFFLCKSYVKYKTAPQRPLLNLKMTSASKHLGFNQLILLDSRSTAWSLVSSSIPLRLSTSCTKMCWMYSNAKRPSPRWYSTASHTSKMYLTETRIRFLTMKPYQNQLSSSEEKKRKKYSSMEKSQKSRRCQDSQGSARMGSLFKGSRDQ